ncbi:peroxidase P7-like [Tasmannia lanceolata]|uniref:peroxidase P7-like n=1 Tax=Tasmannia lanceolata TaxID=3420 RepID=UPI0040640696
MASPSNILTISLLAFLACVARAQLSPTFYETTCPNLQSIVRIAMTEAIRIRPRNGAFMTRLFFHDCFVQGCDGSILLDDTPTFTGEKTALPSNNSLQGFDVIDTIKTRVEAACSGIVSCAEMELSCCVIYVQLDGPSWTVPLGRRDARTASLSTANTQIPLSSSNLPILISNFSAKGLSARDMTALSGSHSVGFAQCTVFRDRIYNDTNIDPTFANLRKASCPSTDKDENLAPLDIQTSRYFENNYYKNLMARSGLLHSDQELFNGGSQDLLVQLYSNDNELFRHDFVAAMVRMGNISPLTGTNGEIRRNCRVVN